ncbi:radical SAM family heme chaperone HemW [Sedimentibacter sp.]|uniref:radical SAM family heme chaperone HemW n=1 Tax=Sedimentibacter sp. TaxID=1960295 RepID=UPI0028ADE428|nr:radical SAM family heme chaperone HemW [Sedimentibacter sp.]
MKRLGIYVHVPFCKKKCNYCDFYSVKWDYEAENKYIEAILNEIKGYKEKLSIFTADTIFFGGGTPTIIKPSNLKRIIESINDLIVIDKNAEITVEANPNTLSHENLIAYKKIGINRLSIGIQSLNDEILKKIGRIHNGDEALSSIDRAKKNGFENINADVMFNIPGQNVKDIENTIDRIIEKDIKHISFYSLKLEKETPLYIMEQSNKITMPEEDEERKMYYAGRSAMEKRNLMQYEISNFALKGYECKHNFKYWNQEEYIGLGPSAHSFLNNIRFSNLSDLNLYCENLKSNKFERITHEELSEDDLMFEYIMLRLRLTEGININEFNNKFSTDFKGMYKMQINYLHKNNLIDLSENNIKLTQKGMDISNYVIEEFMI